MAKYDKVARRRLDRLSMELTFPNGKAKFLDGWQAYANESARLQGRVAGPSEDASVYTVQIRQPSLVAAGQFHDSWVLLVQLNHPNYPKEIAWPTFVSTPVPFNPHVSAKSGVLCSGNLWSSTTTLAEFVVKVMRLLNLDETLPDRESGLNHDATRYWRTLMAGRPLYADLRYPEAQRPTVAASPEPAGLFGTVVVTGSTGTRAGGQK